jgi:hypothetical protein
MGKRDRSAADAERRLADDVRRTAGYIDAVVTRARRLNVTVPEAIAVCADTWRGWVRSMDRRAGEDR